MDKRLFTFIVFEDSSRVGEKIASSKTFFASLERFVAPHLLYFESLILLDDLPSHLKYVICSFIPKHVSTSFFCRLLLLLLVQTFFLSQALLYAYKRVYFLFPRLFLFFLTQQNRVSGAIVVHNKIE